MKTPLILVALALLGCNCEGTEQIQHNSSCDNSLERCVSVLGEKHKEQCYETYHACITTCKE